MELIKDIIKDLCLLVGSFLAIGLMIYLRLMGIDKPVFNITSITIAGCIMLISVVLCLNLLIK